MTRTLGVPDPLQSRTGGTPTDTFNCWSISNHRYNLLFSNKRRHFLYMFFGRLSRLWKSFLWDRTDSGKVSIQNIQMVPQNYPDPRTRYDQTVQTAGSILIWPCRLWLGRRYCQTLWRGRDFPHPGSQLGRTHFPYSIYIVGVYFPHWEKKTYFFLFCHFLLPFCQFYLCKNCRSQTKRNKTVALRKIIKNHWRNCENVTSFRSIEWALKNRKSV